VEKNVDGGRMPEDEYVKTSNTEFVLYKSKVEDESEFKEENMAELPIELSQKFSILLP
jgi:hypothetical protein